MMGLAQNFIGWLWPSRPVMQEAKYQQAMALSDDLLARMREASDSTDAARAVMADIWQQNHNVPFMTTVFESVQEAKSSTNQRPEDR